MKQQFKIVLAGLVVAVGAIMCVSSCAKKDKEDCFTCTSGSAVVNFCHTDGNDFYTMSISGDTQQIELDGRTWASVKADKKAACAD